MMVIWCGSGINGIDGAVNQLVYLYRVVLRVSDIYNGIGGVGIGIGDVGC